MSNTVAIIAAMGLLLAAIVDTAPTRNACLDAGFTPTHCAQYR